VVREDMSSREIKTIYKELVQNYAMAYPSDPLKILSMHIEAYVRYEWKAKEPAVLDLAWRKGIEIPKVKELIERGKTKREAILEASKNMQLKVSETEVEKWLKELKEEKPTRVEEVAKPIVVERVKTYEKPLEEGKAELFGLPATLPTALPEEGYPRRVAKYFIHGIAYSVIMAVLVFVWVFVSVLLVVVGSLIGLIIGFILLFIVLGGLNCFLTVTIWSISTKTAWTSLLGHGLALLIALIIVHIPAFLINLTVPSLATTIVLFIVYAFVDGFVAKNVAKVWKE
jgi:hypothetical protein